MIMRPTGISKINKMLARSLYAAVSIGVFALCGNAETLVVGEKEVFKSISAALASAKAGDTVKVLNGEYIENLVIDRPVLLIGEGGPVVRGTGKGSVITVTAEGCTIRGFLIRNSGGDLQAEDAGILLRSNRNTVEENHLEDVLFGIYLFHSSENRILKNRVVGRKELESGERGAGLHLWNSPNNLIEDNVISFARDGMYVQSSAGNEIRRNRVTDLRYGLHFMNSDANVFEDNVFSENIAGAAIMYSQKIELRRNAFVHNRGFSSFGILFQDCRSCITEDNLVLNNASGVFLEGVKDSVFRRNTIAENDTAVQVFSSSSENTFTENNFINNLSPLRLIGKTSSITWRSNYWSDYDGFDLDADGTGDTAHKIQNIFEYLEGNLPRVRIYLNSPAAESIVAAERSFPVLKGSSEFDREPLMRPVSVGVSTAREEVTSSAKPVLLAFSFLMLGVSALTVVRNISR